MDMTRTPSSTYLPEHWRAWLRSHRPHWGGELSAEDFRSDDRVRLRFGDGSSATFQYAFCALDEQREELAVFTEHCGYHVFRAVDLTYSGRVVTLGAS